MGKFFYYCSEPINHLIVFLNLYCIYYYEDLYINVFFGIFALFVSAGCGKAAEKKCKEYQSFYEFMMINHFLLALNLFYPLMEGYLIWAVFIVLYVLLAYAEKTIFIKF